MAPTPGGGRGGRRRQALRRRLRRGRPHAWWSRRAWPVSSARSRRCATGGGSSRWPRPGTSSAAFDGDRGPNTGGMGSYSPPPEVDEDLVGRVMDEAVEPVVAALLRRGIDFRGVLYAGIMVTDDGPAVLEFNVRFGDPEAQVVLPRLADDPVELLRSVGRGRALGTRPGSRPTRRSAWSRPPPATPRRPRTGRGSRGSAADGQLADPVQGATVLHAGTGRDRDGAFCVRRRPGARLQRAGPDARRSPDPARYAAAERVRWPGMQLRTDIATRPSPPARWSGDPPLHAGRRRVAVQRRGPPRPVARGRAAHRRGAGPRRGRAGGGGAGGARTGPPRSTPPSSTRWPSASGPPTTTWPPSSTSSRQRIGGPEAAWVHFGLTSSDVVDTAPERRPRAGRRPADRGRRRAPGGAVRRGLGSCAARPVTGRTHGMHAEPTTFGAKFALVGAAGGPGPPAAGVGPAPGRGREAVGGGRDLLEHRSRGRGGTCAGRSAWSRCRPPR